MAKKSFTIQIDSTRVEDVLEALLERKSSLDKIASNLLKRKVQDAAKPVFEKIEYLGLLVEHVRSQFNSAQ
jgi:hypothetical protein